jgi:hypothetical protein
LQKWPIIKENNERDFIGFCLFASISFICRQTMCCKTACAMSCSREVTAAAVLNWNEMQIKFHRNHRNFAHLTAINILSFLHKLRTFSAGAKKKFFIFYGSENIGMKIDFAKSAKLSRHL